VTLKPYEDEVLLRMYDKELIMMRYKAIQQVRGMIGWDEIAEKYGVKPSFKNVIRHLANKGYILWKKSGDVASLSRMGVEYVVGQLKDLSGENER